MAVKWAVANGNWSAGATWNDGVVPTANDDVELNGHAISVTTDIVAKTLKNENGGYIECNATTRSVAIGTILQMSTTRSILSLAFSGSPSHFYFSCNIEQRVNKAVISIAARSGYTHTLLINGYITLQPFGYLYELTASNITLSWLINGNIEAVSDYAYMQGIAYNTQIQQLIVNGLCRNIFPRVNVATFKMNGRLDVATSEIVCTNFNINGSITYKSTNNTIGVRYTTLNILNPDTFTWVDITEPRVNPFIIVTDADMNNRQQYPPENEVKQGTEYVWGEKVGTYQQPPESVVLKDYVYDGGEMVGTLDLPQAPTTSDIVTAIKNDSDLGGKIDTTNTNVGNISTAVTTIDGKVDIIDSNVDTLLSRLTSVLTQRLGQSVTVEILQQILVAHLDN